MLWLAMPLTAGILSWVLASEGFHHQEDFQPGWLPALGVLRCNHCRFWRTGNWYHVTWLLAGRGNARPKNRTGVPYSWWTRNDAAELAQWERASLAVNKKPISFLSYIILFSRLGKFPEELRRTPTCSVSDENLTGTPTVYSDLIDQLSMVTDGKDWNRPTAWFCLVQVSLCTS